MSYHVLIQNKLSVLVEFMPCNNLNNECLVPLGALLADYMLEQGDRVRVQVTATNVYGTSVPSALQTVKQV